MIITPAEVQALELRNGSLLPKASRNKYHRAKVEDRTGSDGTVYDSKAEMLYAASLELLKRAGAVKEWRRQIRFPLVLRNVRGESIGSLGIHVVDFRVTDADGTVRYVEVKGVDLPVGRLKRRFVELSYGINIEVVK